MTRRTRRRVYVVALAALIGAGAPVWAPPLLRTLPAFRVERVRVTGETRFVAPEEVAAAADVPPDASVWDEVDRWRRRVEAHPLVARARVRRAGLHALDVSVEEVEPVALAPTPTLRPVSRGGVLLPLDAAEHGLDLPILLLDDGTGDPPGGSAGSAPRVDGEEARTLLDVLARLRDRTPGFVREISSLRVLAGGGIEVRMVGRRPARTVVLPPRGIARALRRVELALAEEEAPVEAADARFRGQVVLDRAGGEG